MYNLDANLKPVRHPAASGPLNGGYIGDAAAIAGMLIHNFLKHITFYKIVSLFLAKVHAVANQANKKH